MFLYEIPLHFVVRLQRVDHAGENVPVPSAACRQKVIEWYNTMLPTHHRSWHGDIHHSMEWETERGGVLKCNYLLQMYTNSQDRDFVKRKAEKLAGLIANPRELYRAEIRRLTRARNNARATATSRRRMADEIREYRQLRKNRSIECGYVARDANRNFDPQPNRRAHNRREQFYINGFAEVYPDPKLIEGH